MMTRITDTFMIDRDLRLSIYKEISRLVANMVHGGEENLRFEITFPDTATRGLHQKWRFTRSIVVQVDPRP